MSTPCSRSLRPWPGDALRLVGGVVQDLDFEPVSGVVDASDRVEQALDDVHLR